MTGVLHQGLAPARTVLPNGTVVIAKHSPVSPAVTMHASVRAGTEFDPPDLGGLAHFVSRTIDRGTASRAADAIADELDDRGVSLAVTVNRHAMWFICTCLVEDLDVILSLLADIVRHPVFPAEQVETRRAETITLVRQDEDNPAVMAVEGLMADLYGADHAYGRRPRGSVETVERIGRHDLQRLHEERFRPAALSLVLVGDVERERAIDAASAAFGGWTGAAPAGSRLAEPHVAAARRVRVIPMANKVQADIAYGFTTITRADPAYYAYALMNNILGQYALGGRIGDRIREREGLAYYAFSALDANVVAGPLTIRAGVAGAHVERTLAAIDEELGRLAAEGPALSELDDSRRYLVGSMPRTLETNLGIATFLQTAEFFGLGLDYDRRLPGYLATVSLEAVADAARRTLVPAHATAVIAGPYEGGIR